MMKSLEILDCALPGIKDYRRENVKTSPPTHQAAHQPTKQPTSPPTHQAAHQPTKQPTSPPTLLATEAAGQLGT